MIYIDVHLNKITLVNFKEAQQNQACLELKRESIRTSQFIGKLKVEGEKNPNDSNSKLLIYCCQENCY